RRRLPNPTASQITSAARRGTHGCRSSQKVLEPAVQLECFGVRQRVPILHLASVNDVSYRHLGDLPADGSGNVGYLDDSLGDMVGTRVLANPTTNPVAQRVIQQEPLAQSHEQHDADVV